MWTSAQVKGEGVGKSIDNGDAADGLANHSRDVLSPIRYQMFAEL